MPADSEIAEFEMSLHLAEYGQIKSEQRDRIQRRDGLVYTTLAAMAAVVAATLQQHDVAALLLLPPVVMVLGWKYLANDEKISAAGRYVRDHLAPRLAHLTNTSSPVFDWERSHREGVYGRVRRYVQFMVDLLTFCVLPACALVGFWTLGSHPVGLVVVSMVEVVLLAGLAWLVMLACLGVPFRRSR